jgi:hypothetical protein
MAGVAARANALLRVVSTVFVLVFALVFVWYGIKIRGVRLEPESELAEMPMTWLFISWPADRHHVVLFGAGASVQDIRIARYGPEGGRRGRRSATWLSRQRSMSASRADPRG